MRLTNGDSNKHVLFEGVEFRKTLEEVATRCYDNDDSERVSLNRCPELIKSTIWFLKSKSEELRTEANVTRYLTKAGLQILEALPGLSEIKKKRRDVYLEGSDLDRFFFINQEYSINRRSLLCSLRTTCYLFKKVLGALANIASDLGIPLSTVTTLALIAGMTTSERWVPDRDKARALEEIKRFAEWVKKRAEDDGH